MSILDEENITQRVAEKTPFTQLLKDVNSKVPNSLLIAGGSITKEMAYPEKFSTPDVDMYVSSEAASYTLNAMHEILKGYNIIVLHQPVYDKSFLKKNGILMTVTFRYTEDHKIDGVFEVQVMICSGLPIDVVTNFDLTCCQNWFDGTHVYGTHLEETMGKLCMLQGDYVKSLIDGNSFIANRIDKYQRRGFSVVLDSRKPFTISPEEIVNDTSRKEMKTFFGTDKYWGTSWEEIVVSYAISTLEVFPETSLNRMFTFNHPSSLYSMDIKDLSGKRLNFPIKAVFYLCTHGFTIKNLISIFGLTAINLGNLFHNMWTSASSYTKPFTFVLLKVFEPYIKPSIFKLYTTQYNISKSVGTQYYRSAFSITNYEDVEYDNPKAARQSTVGQTFPVLDFNENFVSHKGETRINGKQMPFKTVNEEKVETVIAIVDGVIESVNPPVVPQCCFISRVPYYPDTIDDIADMMSKIIRLPSPITSPIHQNNDSAMSGAIDMMANLTNSPPLTFSTFTNNGTSMSSSHRSSPSFETPPIRARPTSPPPVRPKGSVRAYAPTNSTHMSYGSNGNNLPAGSKRKGGSPPDGQRSFKR